MSAAQWQELLDAIAQYSLKHAATRAAPAQTHAEAQHGYGIAVHAGGRLYGVARPPPGSLHRLKSSVLMFVRSAREAEQILALAWLDARHRAHARVEDRIRTGKDTGFGRFPSRLFAINTAWLELALTAIDLLAWTRVLLLNGVLATAKRKKLRYRILHTAARITRGQRRAHRRLAEHSLWARDLAAAFARLGALPRPITS